MNISRDSFFVKLAYGKNIPEQDSICTFTHKVLAEIMVYFMFAILAIVGMTIDLIYLLLTGKSFLLVRIITKHFPKQEDSLISYVPHIWYKGYPVPQVILYFSLAIWSIYKMAPRLNQLVSPHHYLYLAFFFFALFAVTVGYFYKEDLRKVYNGLWAITHYTEDKVASKQEIVIAILQSAKRKTCIKVTFV